ncbi:hypothetical protein MTR67_039540 [Solanum verrucosum]|uniref:Tf2-1-like SH3-like domain-containing protein n=1 Tax=Solanum verrucosum TaxID=315347 RepID=A0AAF0UI45_SOLVR|nr:hypothetical protein MTR67_039540 [Solanum verrucosum]
MQLSISEKGGVLACIKVMAKFMEQIKDKQFEDGNLNELKKNISMSKTQDTTLDVEVRIDYNAEQLAKVYVKDIVSLPHYGTAAVVASGLPWRDSGPVFLKVPLSLINDGLSRYNFRGHWNKFLPLCEVSYNNSYQFNIDMAPFEALYERVCRSPIRWFETGDVKPLGVDLVKDAQDKVRSIAAKLLVACSRQKKFADHKVRDMTFHTGSVAYRLALPPNLMGVHSVFHVSMLKRYHGDGDYIINWDSIVLDKDLQYEEERVKILDRDVRKLRNKEIKSVKVSWKDRPVE